MIRFGSNFLIMLVQFLKRKSRVRFLFFFIIVTEEEKVDPAPSFVIEEKKRMFVVEKIGVPRTRRTKEITEMLKKRGQAFFEGDMVALKAGISKGRRVNIWVIEVLRLYKKTFKFIW